MDRSVPPGQISPFIKLFPKTALSFPVGARWGLLITGIIYGSTRLSALNSREQKRKAELERTRPEREAKEKAEREKRAKEELDELNKLLST